MKSQSDFSRAKLINNADDYRYGCIKYEECPTCQGKFLDPEQIDFIEKFEECMQCDHLRLN